MRSVIISRDTNLPVFFDLDFASSPKSPLILFLHGFKGFKDWGQWPLMAREFTKHGFSMARVSFSHNGTTPEQPFDFADLEAFGKNTFSQEAQDVRDVLDWIFADKECQTKLDLSQIFLVAHSRGGAIAMVTAAEDSRIKKLATLSSVSTLERFSESELAYWKKQGVIHILNARTHQNMPMYYSLVEDFEKSPGRFDLEKVLPQIKQPYLILHAENDETVPTEEAEKIHSLAVNSHFEIIKGADHSYGGGHPFSGTQLPEFTQQAVEKIVYFFQN